MRSIGRRNFVKSLAGASALVGIQSSFSYSQDAAEEGIEITNIYRTRIRHEGWGGRMRGWLGEIVRIETNKGIVGYGECRDLDDQSVQWIETFAPHLVGMNPTKVEEVFNKMDSIWSGSVSPEMMYNQERMGTGAISGIEMACWDILGKVQNVPVYKLLGERLHDKITMYADTEGNQHEDVVGRVEKGFRHYKCDMYLSQIARTGGDNFGRGGEMHYSVSETPNNYGYREITISQTGLDLMHEYMEQYRETLKSFGEPYASAPIGSDHYQGYNARDQLSVESAIALAETLKDHNPDGYVEDVIDWWVDDCSGLPSKEVADATDYRVQTGEDMYGIEQFKPWADIHALDNFHPEPNTFGGLNQTLLASRYADSKGIVTYHHNSSGPIAMVAYAHLAAVSPGFVAMEFHNMDYLPMHDDLIDGVEKPMVQDGYTTVPEGPGLGITPNAEQYAAHGAEWTKVV